MSDKTDPRRWMLQKCRLLGSPREEKPDEAEKLAQVQDIPGPEPWDLSLLRKKKAAKEEFLKRYPLGRVSSMKGPIT